MNQIILDEVAEMVQESIDWFDERMNQLKEIAQCSEQVVIARSDGAQTELTEEQSRVFKAGIATAISLIGDFPLKLEQLAEENDELID